MSVLITVMNTLTLRSPCSARSTTTPHRRACADTSSRTFQAADPPEAGVGERPGVFLVLVAGLLLGRVGRAVADEGAGVQPVVRTDGHRHQGEGGERSHGGQQHLDATLAPNHRRAGKEADI